MKITAGQVPVIFGKEPMKVKKLHDVTSQIEQRDGEHWDDYGKKSKVNIDKGTSYIYILNNCKQSD